MKQDLLLPNVEDPEEGLRLNDTSFGEHTQETNNANDDTKAEGRIGFSILYDRKAMTFFFPTYNGKLAFCFFFAVFLLAGNNLVCFFYCWINILLSKIVDFCRCRE